MLQNKTTKTHDTTGCINSSKCVILMRKRLNIKLEWMKNYDTKKKPLLAFYPISMPLD